MNQAGVETYKGGMDRETLQLQAQMLREKGVIDDKSPYGEPQGLGQKQI